jgi:hypothetical protein
MPWLQRNPLCRHTTRFFRDSQHEGWMLNRPRRICQVRFNPNRSATKAPSRSAPGISPDGSASLTPSKRLNFSHSAISPAQVSLKLATSTTRRWPDGTETMRSDQAIISHHSHILMFQIVAMVEEQTFEFREAHQQSNCFSGQHQDRVFPALVSEASTERFCHGLRA